MFHLDGWMDLTNATVGMFCIWFTVITFGAYKFSLLRFAHGELGVIPSLAAAVAITSRRFVPDLDLDGRCMRVSINSEIEINLDKSSAAERM